MADDDFSEMASGIFNPAEQVFGTEGYQTMLDNTKAHVKAVEKIAAAQAASESAKAFLYLSIAGSVVTLTFFGFITGVLLLWR